MKRYSKQREMILLFLRSTKSHPTADQIYESVKPAIPGLSKGTVYRNLQVLKESGDVQELNFDGSKSHFDATWENHYHFKCDRCGQVFDVEEPVNRDLDLKIGEKTGFMITGHQLEFRGLCNVCRPEPAALNRGNLTIKNYFVFDYSK